MTPRGVTLKGGVMAEIEVSTLVTMGVSLAMGDVSSILEEDIGIETPVGVKGVSSLEGSQIGFQCRSSKSSSRVREFSGWTLRITGRVPLPTGVSGAAEEGDPWSLGTGDGIDGSARMIEFNKKNLDKLTIKDPTQN